MGSSAEQVFLLNSFLSFPVFQHQHPMAMQSVALIACPQLTMSKDLPDRLQWFQLLQEDHPPPPHITYKKRIQQDMGNQVRSQRCNGHKIPTMNSFHKLVKVLVGTAEVPFILHQEALIKVSDYFKSACKEHWMGQIPEDQIGTIRYLSS